MIAVWCDTVSERVRYAFELIFNTILKEELTFCNSPEEFQQSNHLKVAYCDTRIEHSIWVQPHGLLFETDSHPIAPKVTFEQDIPIFFQTNTSTALPFDVFAASFYLCTRYEEYFSEDKDKHDRYTGKESLAVKNNFINQPIVDIWAMKLKEDLKQGFPDYFFAERQFQLKPTIDIDHPFAFRHKTFFRTLGGLVKSFIKFQGKLFLQRIKTLMGQQTDPYQTYDYLHKVFTKYKVKPHYFVLLNNKGANESSVAPDNMHYQQIVANLQGEVGIHPSYGSNGDINLLKLELNRLKTIRKTRINSSRQHFLKLHLPHTYRNLIEMGIENDFSMGYAEFTGFRAGICTPYYFFDLEKNIATKLKIHPFAFMDGTLNYYQNLSSNQAIKRIDTLLDEVKAVKGTFYFIWHNETLCECGQWKGWRSVFEHVFIQAFSKPDNNLP